VIDLCNSDDDGSDASVIMLDRDDDDVTVVDTGTT
jgi:hypothetical protein